MNTLKIYRLVVSVALILFLSGFSGASAQSGSAMDKANQAYKAKKYEEASQLYLSVFNQGETSPVLCYNLGNCYFKLNDFSKSILWYERAQRLAPNDEDIDFNLNVARMKIVDKSDKMPAVFFVDWWNGFLRFFSATTWGILSLLLLIGFLAILSVFLFSNRILFRKVSFYGAIVFLVLFSVSSLAALMQRNSILNANELIVMQPSCNVKSSPDENSTLLFVVHEGIKVSKTDEVGEWIEIKLDNGTKGWIKKADAEVI
jgi:tetratricopeptide (TPR) repeat protein